MTEQNLKYTVPGMSVGDARQVIDLLQSRLNCYSDLQLTLKHVHWNVVGPHFIAVHEMIDPHVDEVRAMADETAERIATFGGSPQGTPGALVAARTWQDYSVGRASTQEHLAALDIVYRGVIADTRTAITDLEQLDPVTQDVLIDHAQKLELFHWFVRAHLEDTTGGLVTADATEEVEAAEAVDQAADRARAGS
ncbi:Dps family protein [Microlunatus soli]|uniref:Starvation-inducible DNA-binding protein n=1 Tax=Microlunatus soli TaxID=630515 RepID=A0A1H1N398_9ACTN|nr:DNA starvation/stationary phase protection protein [Microlunatus soli]SDR93387.1 starvation-inducible DNA-binding protein [Microlunatus soli]